MSAGTASLALACRSRCPLRQCTLAFRQAYSSNNRAPTAPNSEQRQHRLAVFLAERSRQRRAFAETATVGGAAPAIEVTVHATPAIGSRPAVLKLRPGEATPLEVARRLDEADGAKARGPKAAAAGLALLADGSAVSMHRPLVRSCSLRLLHLPPAADARLPPPATREEALNWRALRLAMWRSGAMLMGSVIETAFKDAYTVELVNSPMPYFPSGSFVYDCRVTKSHRQHSLLKLDSGHCLSAWSPNRAELRALSRAALPAIEADEPFEPLDVPLPTALEMFRHNESKAAVIKAVAAAPSTGWQKQPTSTVTVHRVGDFVDLFLGTSPMLASAGQIGCLLVAAVHPLESPDYGRLARFQGAVLRAWASPDIAKSLQARAAVVNAAHPPTRPTTVAAAAAGGAASSTPTSPPPAPAMVDKRRRGGQAARASAV